jgi:hypothetical protein
MNVKICSFLELACRQAVCRLALLDQHCHSAEKDGWVKNEKGDERKRGRKRR